LKIEYETTGISTLLCVPRPPGVGADVIMDYIPKIKFMRLKEAAELFEVSEHYIRKLALSGNITAIRPGTQNGKILVDIQSLEDYFSSQTCKSPVLSKL
jgi:excisionase family DNA binding protein